MLIYPEFDAAMKRHRTHGFVKVDSHRLSYGECLAQVERLALRLAGDIEPGARIGIYLKNSLAFLIAYHATLKLGAIPFLLDPNFGPQELEVIAGGTGLSGFLTHSKANNRYLATCQRRFDEADLGLSLLRPPLPSESAPSLQPTTEVCRFTSGTTGGPKCLEFSGRAVIAAAKTWLEGTELVADDRIYSLASMTNGLSFNTSFLACFLVGASLQMSENVIVPAHVVRQLAAERITRLVGFPTFYRMVCRLPGLERDAFRTLSLAISAGAKLWPWVKQSLRENLGVRVVDYYGIAETGPVTFQLDSSTGTSLGTPLPGCSLKTTAMPDAGADEILVKTPSMATAYLNCPGALEAMMLDGYYRSGDLGYVEGGQLYVTGRYDARISVGARKIDPVEVVGFVTNLPGVRDAVVFAEGDPDAGEQRVVLVVEGDNIARADVLRHCRAELAPYKVPGSVFIVPSIQRNGVGKPMMSEIRKSINLEEAR
jgi:acyl-coenzyme A synthetase/AMP-(fatty) acid ligase